MSLRRILHFGNTEEQYRFCPDEILYIEAVKGEEKSTVFLLNSENVYSLPIGLGKVAKIIDDTLMGAPDSLCKVGRSTIINFNYLSDDIGTNTIRLVAEVDGTTIRQKLSLSVPACKKLAENRGISKQKQKRYQEEHFESGYIKKSYGGGGGYIGFMIKVYEPCERPESYYDIDDDEIMFLGV